MGGFDCILPLVPKVSHLQTPHICLVCLFHTALQQSDISVQSIQHVNLSYPLSKLLSLISTHPSFLWTWTVLLLSVATVLTHWAAPSQLRGGDWNIWKSVPNSRMVVLEGVLLYGL